MLSSEKHNNAYTEKLQKKLIYFLHPEGLIGDQPAGYALRL